MPKRMSATVREAIMTEDRSKLDLKRSVWNDTGFVNVIKVGDKYQARLQVPGDGRGGTKKRRQHALPGLFDTAEDAAVMLAVIKRGFENQGDGTKCTHPRSRTRLTRAGPSHVCQRSHCQCLSQLWVKCRRPWQRLRVCQCHSWCTMHLLWLQRRFRCSPFAMHRCFERL